MQRRITVTAVLVVALVCIGLFAAGGCKKKKKKIFYTGDPGSMVWDTTTLNFQLGEEEGLRLAGLGLVHGWPSRETHDVPVHSGTARQRASACGVVGVFGAAARPLRVRDRRFTRSTPRPGVCRRRRRPPPGPG